MDKHKGSHLSRDKEIRYLRQKIRKLRDMLAFTEDNPLYFMIHLESKCLRTIIIRVSSTYDFFDVVPTQGVKMKQPIRTSYNYHKIVMAGQIYYHSLFPSFIQQLSRENRYLVIKNRK